MGELIRHFDPLTYAFDSKVRCLLQPDGNDT